MPDIVKVLLLFTITFGFYTAGYILRYHLRNLPKIGSALLFLGALLFGASLFLVAQIYNRNANSSFLVLIWLIGIIPLVYTLRSLPLAGLCVVLAYIWINFFVYERFGYFRQGTFSVPLILIFMASSAIFGFGGIHFLSQKYAWIGRIYRLFAINVSFIVLFMLTFNTFSEKQVS